MQNRVTIMFWVKTRCGAIKSKHQKKPAYRRLKPVCRLARCYCGTII